MSDGSSSATEEVQVDTDDLAQFVEYGTAYLTRLTGIFDSIRSERSRVTASLGAASGHLPDALAAKPGYVSSGDPFVELLEAAGANNDFVAEIVTAFGGFNPAQFAADGTGGTIDDRAVIESLDPRTRSALTVARYFPEIFDGDSIDGDLQDRFADIGDGDGMDEIEDRLRERGLEGQALADAVLDIELAARYYGRPGNSEELRALDDANDSNTDGDQKLRATDAWIRTIALTRADPISNDVAAGLSVVRHHAITAWVVDQELEADELQHVFDGDSRIGELSALDQQVLVDGFVGSKVAEAFDEDNLSNDGLIDAYRTVGLAELRTLSEEDFSTELHQQLTSSLTEQAIRLELIGDSLAPDQSLNAAFVAAVLSAETLELVAGDEARFINGLEPERAALFAASLSLDRRFDEFVALGSVEYQAELAAEALRSLSDEAGPGGSFTASGEGFVMMAQSTASIGAYLSFAHPLPFGEQMARATAIVVNPGDAENQAVHEQRLTELFEAPASVSMLASDPIEIDSGTRSQLLHLLIHGTRTADGEPRFWQASDFAGGAEQVSIDLALEHARTYYEVAFEQRLSPQAEAELRELAATDQFQDLIGFNHRSTMSLRSQFMAMAIENDWSAEDFDGGGSGWENAEVNGEYLVWLAQRMNPNLSAAELNNLRAIGASSAGQEHVGLGINTTDQERLAYIDHIVGRGWTVATFEADDPIHNDIINNAFASTAFAAYGPNTEIGQALAMLDPSDVGYAETYVRTALGLTDGGGDELVDRIVDEIGGVDGGAGLQLIPIHLQTGGQNVDLMLFETIRDGERVFVDLNGKSYSDPDDWYKHNELPPARVTYPGIMGETARQSVFVDPASGDHYDLVHRVTENYPDTFSEKYLGWVITGVVIVGGVLMVVGSGGLATPVVGAGGAAVLGSAMVGSVAAYEIATGAHQLYDHIGHGGDWDDAIAVDAYFTLGEGFLTAVSVGSYGVARRGIPLSSNLAGTLTYANRAAEGLEIGLNVQQAWQIIESDMSPAEKRRHLAVLGVLGAAEYGIPFAANRAIAGNQANLADLDGMSDTEIGIAISNGTTSIEGLRTRLGAGQGTTAEVHTVGPIPNGQGQRAFLLDPNNWTVERQQLHDELIANAIEDALAFDAAVGGVPTIYAMRGNTAAGKTRAIPGNIVELEEATVLTDRCLRSSVNPDDFKLDLREADPDLPLTSSQVHMESSILAQRFRAELAALDRTNGEPISMLIDQRLGTANDVRALEELAGETGRQLYVYDIDAPLEVSLVGVLDRTPGGPSPIPPFDIIAGGGFVPVRSHRSEVMRLFENNPELGTYELYGTTSDGRKVLVASVTDGQRAVHHPAMYSSMNEANPSAEVAKLGQTIITDDFITEFTGPLDPGYAAQVRAALEPYVGYTWEEAIADHSRKPPEID